MPSVTWGLLSSVVLTHYLPSFIGVEEMVFGENFDGIVQVVARPDPAECLEFVAYFDQEINRVQWPTFLQQLTVVSFFNQGLGGGSATEHSPVHYCRRRFRAP